MTITYTFNNLAEIAAHFGDLAASHRINASRTTKRYMKSASLNYALAYEQAQHMLQNTYIAEWDSYDIIEALRTGDVLFVGYNGKCNLTKAGRVPLHNAERAVKMLEVANVTKQTTNNGTLYFYGENIVFERPMED